MIVAFDASVLVYFFDDRAPPPASKKDSSRKVEHCKERFDFLIETLSRNSATIIIPTPALAEVLVRAQEGASERLRILKSSRHFRVVSFDERAAIEFAATQANRLQSGQRAPAGARVKAKFDDQIVCIAAVEQATVIYSDDGDIAKLAGSRFEVIGIEDLPLPPEDAQQDMFATISTVEDDDEDPLGDDE